MQVFNNTPDETAFYRLCLNREDVGGALTMIQPTLQSYGFDGPPTPVRLPFQQMMRFWHAAAERVLLLFTDLMHHHAAVVAQPTPASKHSLAIALLLSLHTDCCVRHMVAALTLRICLGVHSQVLLDVAAIQPDRILLLDTYFMVVVFYGATVAEWRRAKYHEQPEHQAFR